MTGYLYVIQPDEMPVYKVGFTDNPIRRRQNLQGQTPHRLRYIRVLDCGSHQRAKAFEMNVLCWLNDCQTHGEWFTDLAAINERLDAVAPAVDVTEAFADLPPVPVRKRTPRSHERLQFDIAMADLREVARTTPFGFDLPVGPDHLLPDNWRERIAEAIDRAKRERLS